ncbi:MAG TPA: GNAT family protein [Dehalococcoidia bacterium]|nr:GNAT family protein [Dehalococcoidia bacterium]
MPHSPSTPPTAAASTATPAAAAPPMLVTPCTLEGRHVRLEPLELEHMDELWEVAQAPELWRWTATKIHSREALRDYLVSALADRERGVALPFTTRDAATGRAIGSTRFGNISTRDRRVEIGWTFVGLPWQRTGVNTEAKYLMLRHAFETWGCVRVELKAGRLNERSRAAIRRIGGVEEGTLRRHMYSGDGSWRDTVYYSILDDEWPVVKARLEGMLAARR